MARKIPCPECNEISRRGGFKTWQIIVAICFFPIGLLALLADREPTICTECGNIWEENHYPGITQAIGLLGLILILMIVINIPIEMLGEVGDVPFTNLPATIAFTNLIAIGYILWWGFKKTDVPLKEVFPLAPIQISLLLPMSLAIFGVGILESEMDNLLRTVLPIPAELAEFFKELGRGGIWSIILIVAVAPLTEELLFRGFILRGFLRRYTVRKAVLASAILFGLFHLNPWQFLGATIAGVLLAWWFVETGSLIPCLFGHALHNAVPEILEGIFHLKIQGYTGGLTEVKFQPLWFDLLGILLTGLGIWLLVGMFRMNDNIPPEDSSASSSL